MHIRHARLAVLALVLGTAPGPALADDWQSVTKDQGVELAYQATGNLARLRFTNTRRAPMAVSWALQVQLATGKQVGNQGELTLDAGATEIVVSTPYRDAGHPSEVKNVTGTISAKQAAH